MTSSAGISSLSPHSLQHGGAGRAGMEATHYGRDIDAS